MVRDFLAIPVIVPSWFKTAARACVRELMVSTLPSLLSLKMENKQTSAWINTRRESTSDFSLTSSRIYFLLGMNLAAHGVLLRS